MITAPAAKYRKAVTAVFTAVLIFVSANLHAQGGANAAVVAPRGSYVQFRDSVAYFTNDSVIWVPSGADTYIVNENDRTQSFYDTLRARAQRSGFTRRLYDIVIVTPESPAPKEIERKSDDSYRTYSGLQIRRIEVRRLDVFGSDINNPTVSTGRRQTNILNRTHINTSEKIIRKNLLFEPGDTVSPLVLSDNERLLRALSYIDDARIFVVPVSDAEADVVVVTKDVYSIGINYDYGRLTRGYLAVFDKNMLGSGQFIELGFPFNFDEYGSPGFGLKYTMNNIRRSFIDFNAIYRNGLGIETHGIVLNRSLVASATKYAGGISIGRTVTTEDLDTMAVAHPLSYNLQDYWLQRSFLLRSSPVERIIVGARYYNNNIFARPFIFADSYHSLQKYEVFLGSLTYSLQRYYKTNLIYAYGRTEDIPFGGQATITSGREVNEFRNRVYAGLNASTGRSVRRLGYFYAGAAIGGYLGGNVPERGIMSVNVNHFSDLITLGRYRVRNFVNAGYMRGIDRFSDEYISFERENSFSGFRNDTIRGSRRFTIDFESALFCPSDVLGFRFVVYAFAGMGTLHGAGVFDTHNFSLASVGLGMRIRNDNLLFKTIHIRLAYFPTRPEFSQMNSLAVTLSGEQLLEHRNFVPGPPAVIQYH
ncbi:MAG: hypothetical protein LBV26_04440 [Bacteroidales bacterium]|jgi:hypothetical protein|nr:hypothetical protein [Bacteroidales bacterium]